MFGKAGEQPAVDHGLSACARFLRRLEHRHQCPLPRIPRLRQKSRGANQPRHVQVMTAGMHDRNGLARTVECGLCAGVRQPGLFSNRQSIHVRTEHDGWPVAIAQQPYHPSLANAVGHLVSRATQPVRGDSCRARLLHGELGVRVDVRVDPLKFRQKTLDSRLDYARRHRHDTLLLESFEPSIPLPSVFARGNRFPGCNTRR